MTELIMEDIRTELQCCLMESYRLSPKLCGLVRRLKGIHAFLMMRLDTSKQEVGQLVHSMKTSLESSEGELVRYMERAYIEKTGYLKAFQEEIEAEINTINTLRRDTEHLLKSMTDFNQLEEINRGRTLLDLFSMMLKNSSVDLELDDNVDCLEFSPLSTSESLPKIGKIITSYPKELSDVPLSSDRIVEGADGNNNTDSIVNKNEESQRYVKELKDCHCQTEKLSYCDKSTEAYSTDNITKKHRSCQTDVSLVKEKGELLKDRGTQTDNPKTKPSNPGCSTRYLRSQLFSAGLVRSDDSISSESSESIAQANKRKKEMLDRGPGKKGPNRKKDISTKQVVSPDVWDTSDDEKFAEELKNIPDIAVVSEKFEVSELQTVQDMEENQFMIETKNFSFGSGESTTVPFTFSPSLNSSPQPNPFQKSPGVILSSPVVTPPTRRRSRGRGSRRKKAGNKSANSDVCSTSWNMGDNSPGRGLAVVLSAERENSSQQNWWEDAKVNISLNDSAYIAPDNCVEDQRQKTSAKIESRKVPDDWWDGDVSKDNSKVLEKSDKSFDSGVSKDIAGNQSSESSDLKHHVTVNSFTEVSVNHACTGQMKVNTVNKTSGVVKVTDSSSSFVVNGVQNVKTVDSEAISSECIELVEKVSKISFVEIPESLSNVGGEEFIVTDIIETMENWDEDALKITTLDNHTPKPNGPVNIEVTSLNKEGAESNVGFHSGIKTNATNNSLQNKEQFFSGTDSKDISCEVLAQNNSQCRVPFSNSQKPLDHREHAAVPQSVNLPTRDIYRLPTDIIPPFSPLPANKIPPSNPLPPYRILPSNPLPDVFSVPPNPIPQQRSIIREHVRKSYRECKSTPFGLLFPPLPAKLLFKFGQNSKFSSAGDYGLFYPIGVTTNSKGEIIVTDTGNNRVQIFDLWGKFVRSIGKDVKPGLRRPSAVVVNNKDEIFVKDDICIHMFTPDGKLIRRIGCKELGAPYGLGMTYDGFLVTLDTRPRRGCARIVIFTQDGCETTSNPYDPLKVYPARSKCRFLDVYGETLIVSDLGRSKVLVSDLMGQLLYEFGSQGRNYGDILEPSGISLDCEGHILLGDSKNNRVQIFTPGGEFLCGIRFSEGSVRPSDIHLTQDNRLIVVNYIEHQIKVYQLGQS